MYRPLALGALAALALVVLGCGGGEPVAKAPAKAAATARAPAPAPALPPGSYGRAEVDKVLIGGPSWIFRRVIPEEVIREGRFVGWRIVAMPDEWKLDLQPGDVVTSVNGHGLERPTDVWAAWAGVARSREVKIAVERGAAKKELVMRIVGEPKQETVDALENGPGSAPRKPSPMGTIVIEDRDSSGE